MLNEESLYAFASITEKELQIPLVPRTYNLLVLNSIDYTYKLFLGEFAYDGAMNKFGIVKILS